MYISLNFGMVLVTGCSIALSFSFLLFIIVKYQASTHPRTVSIY